MECVAWTLRVVIDGAGPRGATLTFTLVDGTGRLMWTSGTGGLVEGSVGN